MKTLILQSLIFLIMAASVIATYTGLYDFAVLLMISWVLLSLFLPY